MTVTEPSLTLPLALAIPDGEHQWRVAALADDGTPLGIFSDARTLRFVHIGLPDLAVTGVTTDAAALAGEPLRINVLIKNQGPVASGDFHIGFYVSPRPAIAPGAVRVERVLAAPLALGATVILAGDVGMPPGLDSGTYYLVVVAGDLDEVAERDRTNNIGASGPIAVTGATAGEGGQ